MFTPQSRSTEQPLISLVLRDAHGGTSLTRPVPGCFTEFSTRRAGLAFGKISLGKHHLFFSPQDNPTTRLYLELAPPENEAEPVFIPVQPLWYDRKLSEHAMPFQMGVEFLIKPDDQRWGRLKEIANRS